MTKSETNNLIQVLGFILYKQQFYFTGFFIVIKIIKKKKNIEVKRGSAHRP